MQPLHVRHAFAKKCLTHTIVGPFAYQTQWAFYRHANEYEGEYGVVLAFADTATSCYTIDKGAPQASLELVLTQR